MVLLVYSVLNKPTFRAKQGYFGDATTYCTSDTTKILVSTHNDVPKEEHQVNAQEASLWAKNHKIEFVQVSSKTGEGLRVLKKLIMDNLQEKEERTVKLINFL